MHFTKMHGLGNDYLYVYGEVPENIAELSRKLSERHFGAGSDGMIYISPSKVADFKMRIFNADGSEAKMCGNGIRCVGKYVYDKGYTDKTQLKIETLSGIKYLDLGLSCGKVKSVTVNMGTAIPEKEKTLTVCGREVTLIPVSVGNPHAVIFVNDIENALEILISTCNKLINIKNNNLPNITPNINPKIKLPKPINTVSIIKILLMCFFSIPKTL